MAFARPRQPPNPKATKRPASATTAATTRPGSRPSSAGPGTSRGPPRPASAGTSRNARPTSAGTSRDARPTSAEDPSKVANKPKSAAGKSTPKKPSAKPTTPVEPNAPVAAPKKVPLSDKEAAAKERKRHQANMTKLAEENQQACKELMITGMKLTTPHERVKMCQWVRKLSDGPHAHGEYEHVRSEYLQYLRVSLQGDYQTLTKPFNTSPPENIPAFTECLANKVADACPGIPRAGLLQPVLCHKSDDNRAFMCIKRTTDNNLLCYMAVTPDSKVVNSD